MFHKVILSVFCLVLFISAAAADRATKNDSYYWPLKLPKKLSSGFGDTRPGRFHMGIDLRTNAGEGYKVYAPEDGYVWRIKTSYRGYGKGLYVKGNSGRLYVFGHLQKYNWDIGTYLRNKQIENRRYYQDLYPKANELPVKKGQLIARTGQSGAGPPHLHFEIRDDRERPLNPLLFSGIYLGDKTPPEFEAVWLTYQDDHSLFNNGSREIQLVPGFNQKTKTYTVKDTVVVTGRFAVKTAIHDIIASGSFHLGPAIINLYIDGKLYHGIEYDCIDYSENPYSLLDRDLDPAKKEYKRVYNLFRKPGNKFSGYAENSIDNGYFADDKDGFHNIVIKAVDNFSNYSRLEFVIYYLHRSDLLEPLNQAKISDSIITFPLAPSETRVNFDSLAIYSVGSEGADIRLYPVIEIDNNLMTITGDLKEWQNYRLRAYKDGIAGCNYNFSLYDYTPNGEKVIDTLITDITGEGLLFNAKSRISGINWLIGEIINDNIGDRLYFIKTGPEQFSAYYHPDESIENIRSIIIRGPVGFRPDTQRVSVQMVRAGYERKLQLNAEIALSFEDDDLFHDGLLRVRDTFMVAPASGYFVHGPFILDPPDYAFADWADFQVSGSGLSQPDKTGLYVYDEEDGWLWAGGDYDPNAALIHCPIGGGGIIAVIADTIAPKITNLNITEKRRIKISRPEIKFVLDEELSGIENDLNFDVTIDDEWIVPEFDPDLNLFVSKPHWRLHEGRHVLKINVTDRSGNKTSLIRKFYIGAQTSP